MNYILSAAYMIGAVITFVIVYKYVRDEFIESYGKVSRVDALFMFIPSFISALVWFIVAPLWVIVGFMTTDGEED